MPSWKVSALPPFIGTTSRAGAVRAVEDHGGDPQVARCAAARSDRE